MDLPKEVLENLNGKKLENIVTIVIYKNYQGEIYKEDVPFKEIYKDVIK